MAQALKRRLGVGLLTAYGIGIMVGAGIYVLVGHAAGEAGVWAPLSFILAGLVAVPTALSFAALSARIPEAAGDSAYVERGLQLHWLAVAVGLVNIGAGIIAGAAVLRGGVGYLMAVLPVEFVPALIALGILLTLISILGVLESLSFVAVLTLIELVGLCMAIWAGFVAEPSGDWLAPAPIHISGVLGASIFAFFAFIGFDDMVNMAEEVRDPGRTMPRAIIGALVITSALYALVALASVRAVPLETLAGSERPLTLVWQAGTGQAGAILSVIAVAAALNGVLANIVMASRVLFGLGRRSRVLSVFTHAHPRFGTPVLASLLVGAAQIGAAVVLPVDVLAEYTTLALLVVFVIVNASLIGLKRREGPGTFKVPIWVPWLGILASIAMFAANFAEELM